MGWSVGKLRLTLLELPQRIGVQLCVIAGTPKKGEGKADGKIS